MEKRSAKILIGSAGGTASKNSNNYKISLPSSWVKKMDITSDNRDVIISFDGENITISKKCSAEEFAEKKKKLNHDIKKFRLFDNETLCTVIYADYTDETASFQNYTDKLVNTAFGKKDIITWQDLYDFLEERCVSRTRSGIREYLEAIGVDEYDPLKIIEKTKGRMAEDSQWLEVSDVI